MNDASRALLQILHEEMFEKRLEIDLGLALRTRVYGMSAPPTLDELEEVVRQFLPSNAGDHIIDELRRRAGEEKTQ
jgi:hypothetical protein